MDNCRITCVRRTDVMSLVKQFGHRHIQRSAPGKQKDLEMISQGEVLNI